MKANQIGIVVLALTAILFREPWILVVTWAVQLLGLVTKGKANLFIAAAKPFLRTEGRDTQAAELTLFNNTLAVLFLTLSLVAFLVGWPVMGYVFAGMLVAAAIAALSGFCIGCTVYYQFKQFKARHRLS